MAVMRARRPFDTRVYAAVLHLLPPVFRDAFAGDMLQDFQDGRREAGRRGRLPFLMRTLGDLGRTVARQWWRTGWPVILASAAAIPLLLASTVAALWPRDPFPVSPALPDRDAIVFSLLAIVVLFVITSTVLITLWTNQLVRRRLRRRI
jgi:hypothetical protein